MAMILVFKEKFNYSNLSRGDKISIGTRKRRWRKSHRAEILFNTKDIFPTLFYIVMFSKHLIPKEI